MNPEQLQIQAERIRASGVLGRSDLMLRLFDFLVACSAADKTPKEIEIAIDVFGKDAQFEVTRDAMVRVYMHKLRRKLDEFYAASGNSASGRLSIPRGEYRLIVDTVDPASAVDLTPGDAAVESILPPIEPSAPPESQPTTWRRISWQAAAAVVIVVLLTANIAVAYFGNARDDLRNVQRDPIWNAISSDDRPVYIVLGDYYIFGELDPNSPNEPDSVRRLVREFNINSRNDLEQLFKDHPETSQRYMDVALSYLPVSSAYALHSVVPVIESGQRGRRQVQVVMASELTSAMIRSSHIVYIGLISGMGILQDIAFTGSQFRIGDTYDELINRKTNQMYVSQSSVSVNDSTRYRDYGYFSTFDGPNKNRIVILAGTRDVALMHIAEAVSHPDTLQTLTKQAGSAANFEALYAVDAIDRMNLDGKLLLTSKLDTADIWASNVAGAEVKTLH